MYIEFLPHLHAVTCLSLSRFVCATPWQNNGQGLGFVLAGSVLDKRSLKTVFLKLIAALENKRWHVQVRIASPPSHAALGCTA